AKGREPIFLPREDVHHATRLVALGLDLLDRHPLEEFLRAVLAQEQEKNDRRRPHAVFTTEGPLRLFPLNFKHKDTKATKPFCKAFSGADFVNLVSLCLELLQPAAARSLDA